MKISVIIPIYNIMDCLERCVRSVQNQTYEDLEIILVDDGSTDGTSELVDKLADSDVRTTAYHKPNGGSSSARNFGIKRAAGDYLGFVDSDDYIEADMYEKLARSVKEHDLRIAQICRDEISADGSAREAVVDAPESFKLADRQEFIKELLLHKGDCSFCTKLTDRRLFDIALFPEGELNEDFWLLIQMLSSDEVKEVGILPDTGYHVFYRQGSNSRTVDRKAFPRVFTDIVVNADRMEKLIPQKFPKLNEYVQRFALVQRLDYMLHIPVAMMKADNDFYIQVKKYLKSHRAEIKTNPYLNEDQRSKLKMLAAAPRFIRWVHMMKMKLCGQY